MSNEDNEHIDRLYEEYRDDYRREQEERESLDE